MSAQKYVGTIRQHTSNRLFESKQLNCSTSCISRNTTICIIRKSHSNHDTEKRPGTEVEKKIVKVKKYLIISRFIANDKPTKLSPF